MSQSLYDALHGMPPEELWARYQQYPWRDTSGKMVMQGEPNYYQGPGLPSNVKTTNDFTERGHYVPGGDVFLNPTLGRGQALETLNHETQHQRQFADGNTFYSTEPYEDRLTEAQARAVGSMSRMPAEFKSITNPLSLMLMGKSDNEDYDVTSLVNAVAKSSYPFEKKIKALEKLPAFNIPKEQTQKALNTQILDMKTARHKFGKRVAPSLMELLQQGREFYYPPAISDGLQK